MKRFFFLQDPGTNASYHPFFFVFVDPAESCGLESFGSLWCIAAAGVQTFQKERKTWVSFW
jgi:hypothetical protein